jgi:hypothetical protein
MVIEVEREMLLVKVATLVIVTSVECVAEIEESDDFELEAEPVDENVERAVEDSLATALDVFSSVV